MAETVSAKSSAVRVILKEQDEDIEKAMNLVTRSEHIHSKDSSVEILKKMLSTKKDH